MPHDQLPNDNGRQTTADNQPQTSSEALRRELERVRQEAAANLDGWKRAKADYLNLKRDAERERVELAKFANLTFLVELLPVLDNFHRAMRHLPAEQAQAEWVRGIRSIQQQLWDVLVGMGVRAVPTDGAFDPALHEAVVTEAREGIPSGTILDVVQAGYTLHERLLRPASVKVAR